MWYLRTQADLLGAASQERLSADTVHSIQLSHFLVREQNDEAGEIYEANACLEESDHLWASLAGWFLGQKAENIDYFCCLAEQAMRKHAEFRRDIAYPTDSLTITDAMKQHRACKDQQTKTDKELQRLCEELQKSVPFASTRYQAHHIGDVSMPALLGYIAALLYNQNNTAYIASPVTSLMEQQVAEQMCEMLGFGRKGTPKPWGHITSGGSYGILESLWSSRNAKFYPLTVKHGLQDQRLSNARRYQVTVRGQEMKYLVDCSQWELLNLSTDEILEMSQKVIEMAGVDPSVYSRIICETDLTNLGFCEFFQTFGLSKIPAVLLSTSVHYAWSKAFGILGLGEKSMHSIPSDENGRLSIKDLKQKLYRCMEDKIPVISVVAVIGTTELGAVDNLVEILKLRKEMRLQGLDFAINLDAAFGGYFCTMLQPIGDKITKRDDVTDRLLSDYTVSQLLAIQEADTIVCDPHKAGFSAFPAGGLCFRNENMKRFIQKGAAYVQGGNNPEMGLCGIGGSKPGASAAGILLSNRVISLDRFGLGRILGQCVFGSKLLYCVLLSLANEKDDFVCVPLKPPQITGKNDEEVATFTRRFVLGKTMDEISQDPYIVTFLRDIGPDLPVNAFAVNKIHNKNLELCNKINQEIFRRCSASFYDIHRVQLFYVSSKLSAHINRKTTENVQRRLGLTVDDKTDVTYLLSACMNPWTTSTLQAYDLGSILRQTVLNAIGQVTDKKDNHSFICVGNITDSGEIFGEYISNFNCAPRQYHAVTKVQFVDQKTIKAIRHIQDREDSVATPIIFRLDSKNTLGKLLEDGMKTHHRCSVMFGPQSSKDRNTLQNSELLILDTPLARHLDMTVTAYPSHMSYFLYGDENGTYLSHVIDRKPSFQQIVALDAPPSGISKEMLRRGMYINIKGISGTPEQDQNGHIINPLERTMYQIECKNCNGQHNFLTGIALTKPHANVYFDGHNLNSS